MRLKLAVISLDLALSRANWNTDGSVRNEPLVLASLTGASALLEGLSQARAQFDPIVSVARDVVQARMVAKGVSAQGSALTGSAEQELLAGRPYRSMRRLTAAGPPCADPPAVVCHWNASSGTPALAFHRSGPVAGGGGSEAGDHAGQLHDRAGRVGMVQEQVLQADAPLAGLDVGDIAIAAVPVIVVEDRARVSSSIAYWSGPSRLRTCTANSS